MTILEQAPYLLERAGTGDYERSMRTAVGNGMMSQVEARLTAMANVPDLRQLAETLGRSALDVMEEQERGFNAGNPAALAIAYHTVTTVDRVSFRETRTLEELKAVYENHPNRDDNDVISDYNAVIVVRVLDGRVPFHQSLEYYDNLRQVTSLNDEAHDEEITEAESEVMAQLHLALDQKFLRRLNEVSSSFGGSQVLAGLLQNYELKTSSDHEEYEALAGKLGDFMVVALRGQLAEHESAGFINDRNGNNSERNQSLGLVDRYSGDEAVDFSGVNVDLRQLSADETPQLLKDMYAISFTNADTTEAANQAFVGSVLGVLRDGVKLNYSMLRDLGAIHGVIDDERVKNEVARIHDGCLLVYVKKLDREGDYSTIFNLLGSTRFLEDDHHPVVIAGRELYEKSYRKLREGKAEF